MRVKYSKTKKNADDHLVGLKARRPGDVRGLLPFLIW